MREWPLGCGFCEWVPCSTSASPYNHCRRSVLLVSTAETCSRTHTFSLLWLSWHGSLGTEKSLSTVIL